MMRGSNSRRCVVSPHNNGLRVSVFLLISLLACPGFPPRFARAAEAPTAAKTADLAAPKVDWSNAREVHRRVKQWVAAGNTRDAGAAINVTGMSGVKVTLRWSGLHVGEGEYWVPDPAAKQFTGEAIDLNSAARVATEMAIKAAEQSLQESRARIEAERAKQKEPATRPAATTQPYTLSNAAKWITIDVQLATRLEPIRLTADAPADAVYLHFAPGFHGLRMTQPATAGRASEAWKWPASSVAMNVGPSSQLVQLLSTLGLSDETLKKVARPDGPTLQRFEVIHVTQYSIRDPAMQLVRGNVVLPPAPLNGRTLDAIIHRLGDHLMDRVRNDGEMSGTYWPSNDRFEPANATDEDLAVTALALTRWVARGAADASLRVRHAEIERAVKKMADLLVIRLQDKNEPLDPAPTALLLMTLVESPALRDMKDARDAAGKRLLSLRRDDGVFRAGAAADAAELSASTRALITAALARLYERTREPELGKAIRQSRDAMWANMTPLSMAAALPWLMIVEADSAILEEPIGVAPKKDAAPAKGNPRDERARRIRVMVQILRETQVTRTPTLGPVDVVGGFDLSSDRPAPAKTVPGANPAGAPPLALPGAGFSPALLNVSEQGPPSPDWRSAYAVWFIAAAMREPGVIRDADQIDCLLSGGLGVRFLAQLMFDEPSCFYVRSPSDALGGIRLALWDNRLEIPSTAISLIAAIELDRTATQLAEKGLLGETK